MDNTENNIKLCEEYTKILSEVDRRPKNIFPIWEEQTVMPMCDKDISLLNSNFMFGCGVGELIEEYYENMEVV